MAGRFPRLTPDKQKRMHERMGEYARLTPEQRKTARENFRQAYELPADQRQEKLQRYQALPDEKKRALTEQATKKAAQSPTPPPSCARRRPHLHKVSESIDSLRDQRARATFIIARRWPDRAACRHGL